MDIIKDYQFEEKIMLFLNKDVNFPFKKRKKKYLAVYLLLIGLGIII